MNTGATSSTPGTWAISSPTDSGITALENAKNIEELGGWTIKSAPTPSARSPQSARTPEVSPTMSNTRNTCSETATMLSTERKGRARRFCITMCQRVKRWDDVPVVSMDTERSEEHTSELQSLRHLVCRLLLEK